MSVKSDLLKEIEAKAKKLKERKEKVKTKDDVESFVFEFFREAEDMNKLGDSLGNRDRYGAILTAHASQQLEKQLQQRFDRGARLEITMTDKNQISGVLIHWSKFYQVAHKVDETLYIGVEQMLFS